MLLKMKKTDIGVVVVMYAICAFFYSMCVKLKPESQTYPLFTIALLFGLTTMYLVQMLIRAKKNGVESGVDEVFAGFMPLQFFSCVAMVLGYLVLMYFVGFYISTLVFMVAIMLFLKVPKLHMVITIAAMLLLIYFAFTMFLGVKLPAGILFK